MLSVCYLEEAHLGSWAFKYQQNHQCVHVFVSITESWQKAMVYRINTISFFSSNYIPPKSIPKNPGEFVLIDLLGGNHCFDSSASTEIPMSCLTRPMEALLTFCPLQLLFPQEWLEKCYTALTAAALGMFTATHSHSTWVNIACLLTDLPSDFSLTDYRIILYITFFFLITFWNLYSGDLCWLAVSQCSYYLIMTPKLNLVFALGLFFFSLYFKYILWHKILFLVN